SGSAASAGGAPTKPADGSPMHFEVTSLKPGEMFKSEVGVRAYNFGDKPIAGYNVMLRYHDAKGALIAKQTNFGETSVFGYSFTAKEFTCEPRTWCTFTIDPEVPAGAVKGEMIAQSLRAVNADGMTMEAEDLFDRPGIGDEWPEPTAAPTTPATSAAAAKPVEAK
ncbi:MAG: hypothetical protein H0T89_30375, partial [Deltaproteobacteria bacterium]|nr:hypothetical protein [Deltaproteobacteria bacterium]